MPGYRLVLWLVALVSTVVGGCPTSQQPPPTPPQQQQSGYVGADVCMGCHGDLAENLRTTPHVKLLPQAGQEPAAQWGCEACHGPGEAHVAAGGGKGAVGGLVTFRDEAAQVRSEACLACHQKEAEQFHFRRSEHKLTGVACNDCHAPHFPKMPAGLLRQQTPELCFACHQETRAAFALPVHHKVLEGAVRCTDCHTPHGSQSRFSLRGVHNETCTQCHVEKGGPFAFEHLASRIEGCTSCHTPHGSTNKFLLKRREERVLCLECHSNAPLFHNQAAGAFFQGACTRCHTEIHGSNFDRFFFR
jgi:DmsE family decaheme c-type cytochrome